MNCALQYRIDKIIVIFYWNKCVILVWCDKSLKKIDTADVLDAIINRPLVLPQPPTLIQDDLSKFLLGLGATMKQFKPVRLAQVKMEIASVVGKAEIENAIEIEEDVTRSMPKETETFTIDYLDY